MKKNASDGERADVLRVKLVRTSTITVRNGMLD